MTATKSITHKQLKELCDRIYAQARKDGAGPIAEHYREAFQLLIAEAKRTA